MNEIRKLIFNIIVVPLGILAGSITIYLTLLLVRYEIQVYLAMDFLIMITLIALQLPCLMLLAWGFKRITKLHFSFSGQSNFIISFSFPIIYVLCLIIIDRTRFLSEISTIWFEFIVLPVAIFVPLVFVVYFLARVIRHHSRKEVKVGM